MDKEVPLSEKATQLESKGINSRAVSTVSNDAQSSSPRGDTLGPSCASTGAEHTSHSVVASVLNSNYAAFSGSFREMHFSC